MPLLSNASLVELEGFGHVNDVYLLQPDAIEHLIAIFLDTGKVDDTKFKSLMPLFQPEKSFVTMMKMGLFVLSVIVLLVMSLIVFLIIRKSKNSETSKAG